MSTISGCSIGDSGTQSDPEDRKVLVNDHQDSFTNELKSAVMTLNYQTVPAPKPVKPGTFLLRGTTFETIQVRELLKFKRCFLEQMFVLQEKPNPPSNENDDQHYIRYPPCGLPIPGKKFLYYSIRVPEIAKMMAISQTPTRIIYHRHEFLC